MNIPEDIEYILSTLWGHSFTPKETRDQCIAWGYLIQLSTIKEVFAVWDKEFNEWCDSIEEEK